MKSYKFTQHTNKKGEDILVNPREFQDVGVGDVLEIYHTDDENSRLLLQVRSMPDDFPQKDSVSIDKSVVTAFHLRPYVHVRKVDPKDVAVDLVELLFREQYYSRSDMWRMWRSLVNTCMYLNKKLEFTEMKCHVSELWAKGEKVTCGVISEDTRVVFRSSTSVVSIFIQMSSEMWEFDNYGDLYFEKAVDGFLTDLFAKWKENNCIHDVTIVLFSRTFYDASSIADFPPFMHECILTDHKGQYYEDFYRIVIQNERYEDWGPILIQLKKFFNEYLQRVLHYHECSGYRVPKARNSPAVQGNFLETLNMAINLFEKWYVDRNFDRTGKVAVVITPGAGVFEVDRELCNITKQRTIDCGVGSDLVCVGEQPLHAVPLFKFRNKSSRASADLGDDYNIPHWMNHSFYTSRNQAQCLASLSFVPRIKPPPTFIEAFVKKKKNKHLRTKDEDTDKMLNYSPPFTTKGDENFPFIDYDEYDAQVFKLPTRPLYRTGYIPAQKAGLHGCNTVPLTVRKFRPRTLAEARLLHNPRDRHISDNLLDLHCASKTSLTGDKSFTSSMLANASSLHESSSAIQIPLREQHSHESSSSSVGCFPVADKASSRGSLSSVDSDDAWAVRPVVGSAGSPVDHSRRLGFQTCRNRALINPFAPSRMQFKMTSNRRRWVHAFPTDPRGAAVQTHHIHASSVYSDELDELGTSPPNKDVMQAAQIAVELRNRYSFTQQCSFDGAEYGRSLSPSGSFGTSSLHGLTGGHSSRSAGGGSGTASAGGPSPAQSHSTLGIHMVPSQSSIVNLPAVHDASNTSVSKHLVGGLSREMSETKPLSLWGATGEQQWTPDITTGVDWRPLERHETLLEESHLVKPILSTASNAQNFCATISVDWKSLIIPASLPISTDYFPDKRSLHYDYVQNDYSLLPDDVNNDYWLKPPQNDDEYYYRPKPPITVEVFQELIMQRLSQGFQMIIFPKTSSSSSGSCMNATGQYQHTSQLKRARHRDQSEFYLSIGRIFHKLTLTGPTIIVTRYRPRHPQPQLCQAYHYRFQAPDSYNYDVSWTNFSNEKLENYNWNYLDQFILTNGKSDYQLMESLKFWRCRFFLLPCNNPATKKILDGSKRCDIYEEKSPEELQQLIDGFVRYVEIINKIKRTSQRRSRAIPPPRRTSTTVKAGSSNTRSDTTRQDDVTMTDSAPMITSSTIAPMPGESRKAIVHASPATIISQTSDIATVTMGYSDSYPSSGHTSAEPQTPDGQLGTSSSSAEIIEAMLHPGEGIQCLSKQIGLHNQCFVAAEAVDWCVKRLHSVTCVKKAIGIMQRLIDDKYICHASGDFRHKFIYGFYLYIFLATPEKMKAGLTGADLALEVSSNPLFSDEWCEVHVVPVTDDNTEGHVPAFFTMTKSGSNLSNSGSFGLSSSSDLLSSQWSKKSVAPSRKYVNVDVDAADKSERKEMAKACYPVEYSPLCAFDLELQWLVATGTILGELVYSWARKAGSCGFHLLPVPLDPFALPYIDNSDPLRGPIFVPLDLRPLATKGNGCIFNDCDNDMRMCKILELQDAIVKRYGFLEDRVRHTTNTDPYAVQCDDQRQYVHCTGGMFILIPDQRLFRGVAKEQEQDPNYLHYDYIARQTSTSDMSTTHEKHKEMKIGFLWSWNFMCSKRWRNPNTGDENFQDRMLADFREFCLNADERLLEFWNDYRFRLR